VPVAREEMSRGERIKETTEEKERIKKAGGFVGKRREPESEGKEPGC
jgi:hypothetical protein